MNRIFVERAPTYLEAEMKARAKYGDSLRIIEHKTVSIRGGFLKLFSRDGVEITGIVPQLGSITSGGLPAGRGQGRAASVPSSSSVGAPVAASMPAASLDEESITPRPLPARPLERLLERPLERTWHSKKCWRK
jgi:hypothetical protein